ncbi:cupin domain-containing protein [Phytohabitans sp. ZYX-F-186]|uniref:Cupin domain-containing protein n=1 Tax=Phytohabitans maris TaxID=3071409 RepID=A0ABU0ZK30_9ACTN|nr:cupin domain-containing protein [Phytohabitans sp. ZYX-F-186]MDQ7907411.1 cupin domain-containing protein [Phytohabitans sp. ZYX-F-186]
MTTRATARKVAMADVAPDRRRGADVRVLLSPRSAGTTSGFNGVVTMGVGERVSAHHHPYSEEFLFVVRGRIRVQLDGTETELAAGDSLLIPPYCSHRLVNDADEEAFVVFHLGPLAPRPELGHVDTETELPEPARSEGRPA